MKCKMTTMMIFLILCAVLFPVYAESNVVADNQSAAANNGSQAIANSGGSVGNIAGGSISAPVNISDDGKISNSKKSFMEQIELLRGKAVGYYFAVFVAAITAILQLLKKTNEYLEKFHVTKKLARYSALIECCDENTQEYKFMTNLKLLETFKVATNINTTPNKSKFIMKLYDIGMFTVKDLRQVYTFFDVSEKDKAICKYSILNKIEVIWASIATTFISLIFFAFSVAIKPNNLNQFFAYIAIVSLYLLFMYGTGEPIRTALTYRRFKKILKQEGFWEETSVQPTAQLERI